MGIRLSRRVEALLSLVAAALTTGCPPINPPGPGPVVDPTAERKAISSLLGEKEVSAFFQSRLINDGVGIFSASEEILPTQLPRRWGRSYARAIQGVEERSADAFNIALKSSTEAEGSYQKARAGKLVLDFTWQRKLLSKPFVDIAQRKARFRKTAQGWQLSAVTLASIQPKESGLRVGEFLLTVEGHAPRRIQSNDYLALADLPLVQPDQEGRIEVQLAYDGAVTKPAVYAFLHVPPMLPRLRLRDDGSGGDVKADDGVYSARFFFPNQPGLSHLVIDAIAGKTFADPTMTNYDAAQWGLPYRVQGGEAR